MSDSVIRLCSRKDADNPTSIIPTSIIKECGRCDHEIWVDGAQVMPPEIEGLDIELVCMLCAMQDPSLAPGILEHATEVARVWLETGETRTFPVGDEEES